MMPPWPTLDHAGQGRVGQPHDRVHVEPQQSLLVLGGGPEKRRLRLIPALLTSRSTGLGGGETRFDRPRSRRPWTDRPATPRRRRGAAPTIRRPPPSAVSVSRATSTRPVALRRELPAKAAPMPDVAPVISAVGALMLRRHASAPYERTYAQRVEPSDPRAGGGRSATGPHRRHGPEVGHGGPYRHHRRGRDQREHADDSDGGRRGREPVREGGGETGAGGVDQSLVGGRVVGRRSA